MEKEFINKEIENSNERLVSLVCANMLKETTYYQSNDQKIENLIRTLNEVYETEPEFILQLAYYGRKHMNLRSTPNFLLAYSSIRKRTRAILQRYFLRSTCLPSDVLEVVDLSQVLSKINFADGKEKIPTEVKPEWKLTMSRELTECIKYKFSDFDEYQLGKYCSDKRRKTQILKRKRLREKIKKNEAEEQQEYSNVREVKSSFGLRRGFRNKALPWGKSLGRAATKTIKTKKGKVIKVKMEKEDPKQKLAKMSLVNMKRLIKICKIQKPSILVNKVLGKKYPSSEQDYSEMLKEENEKYVKKFADSSKKFDKSLIGKRMKIEIPKTWETELAKRGNQIEVWDDLIATKSVPILATLRNLRHIIKSQKEETHKAVETLLVNSDAVIKSKVLPFQFYSAYRELQNNLFLDGTLKNRYKNALETSLRISTSNNITNLEGKALIFVDVSGSMQSKISCYSNLQMRDCAILLGLMLNFSCSQVEFRAFSSPGEERKGHLEIKLNPNYILKNFDAVNKASQLLGSGTDIPYDRLIEVYKNKEKFDYIFIISDMMIRGEEGDLETFLKIYRTEINPLMKYVAINLNSYGMRLEDGDNLDNRNNPLNIHITGFSEQILSLVAESDMKTQVQKIKEVCAEELKN